MIHILNLIHFYNPQVFLRHENTATKLKGDNDRRHSLREDEVKVIPAFLHMLDQIIGFECVKQPWVYVMFLGVWFIIGRIHMN